MLLTSSGKQWQLHTATDMIVVKNDNVHIDTEI